MNPVPWSWAANRTEAGLALLGFVWSSAFTGAAFAFAVDDPDSVVALVLSLLASLAGLVFIVCVTIIGCRLAFGQAEPRQRRERRARSDVQIMALLALGTILAIVLTIVVATLVI